jgi:ribosomal protein L12E/L44/L45/RPP1/RPP2
MQVRHLDEAQLQLEQIKKLDGDQLVAAQEEKPWEEVVECLAVLAAIHAAPCQSAKERTEEEQRQKPAGDAEPKQE